MFSKVFEYLFDISSLPVLCLFVSVPFGLYHWNRLPRPFKILVCFLVFCLLIEISARVASFVFKMNLPLLHLYTFGECLLLSLFYKSILDDHSIFRKYFNLITWGVLLLVVLNSIFVQSIFGYNSNAKTLVHFLIILYAVEYAFRFSEVEDIRLGKPLQIVNSAVLVYYCGTIFVFMSSFFDLKEGVVLRILWDFNAVLDCAFQLTMFFALWKVIFTHQNYSSSRQRVF